MFLLTMAFLLLAASLIFRRVGQNHERHELLTPVSASLQVLAKRLICAG